MKPLIYKFNKNFHSTLCKVFFNLRKRKGKESISFFLHSSEKENPKNNFLRLLFSLIFRAHTDTHDEQNFPQNSRDYKHKRLHKRGNAFKVKLRFEIEIRAAVEASDTVSTTGPEQIQILTRLGSSLWSSRGEIVLFAMSTRAIR